MIYLSACGAHKWIDAQAEAGIGLMLQERGGARLIAAARVPYWAADNGCYSTGERFSVDAYLRWLARMDPVRSTCLFATAPDVVGDARATLKRSAPVLPLLSAAGYTPALVAQDGLERLCVPWDTFGVLFIGGTTEWKLSPHAAELIREARARGKWVHMGRVNGGKRFVYAAGLGCDSADGTYLVYRSFGALLKVERWRQMAQESQQQPALI